MSKKISVLMGIYNCADTLEQAVASIRNQTYKDWELILCDDGSSDNTFEVAQKLAAEEPRIILLRNDGNKGLNTTLNNCLAAATGEYVARMDGDDDCLPERFEKQITFLEKHPEFQITSCPMILFDENGEWGETHVPEQPTAEDVVCGTAISHAPMMMYRECMTSVGGYAVIQKQLMQTDCRYMLLQIIFLIGLED